MSTQRELFPESMPWDDDELSDVSVAQVVFAEGVSGEFDYAIPDRLLESVVPGIRVKVPLGRSNRTVLAYCVGRDTLAEHRKLKQVIEVVDSEPLLNASMLRLTKWLAQRYCSQWGHAIEASLPAAVRHFAGTREVKVLTVPNEVLVRIPDLALPAKQQQALRFLAGSSVQLTARQLADRVGCTTAPIKQLQRKGLVNATKQRVISYIPPHATVEREAAKNLTADQRMALDQILKAIADESSQPILLHGVTSSGKTEVYIQAIAEVVRYGRQAVVLVPEISLTPQTSQRFRARFDSVAVLHSHQSGVERASQWKQIAAGQIQVVVGARSAIFAPVPRLGLIVLDEEHDGSFKQEQVPRYHARDVAIERCRTSNVPLILGSATPSLETYFAAQEGRYQLVPLPQRVHGQRMPDVRIIDTRSRHPGVISRPLHQAMRNALDEQGQIILLLNRRGHASQIQCPACGFVMQCPDCDITLTNHKTEALAICHYCEFQTASPDRCPQCGFESIRFSGFGTQRLEDEVRTRFPKAGCLRMDSDSMKKPGSHETALAQFRAGEHQILLGTQMIAKGLDFPNVTLVGVINADTGLHMPNFRAAERTFQLVTQVAGRTGRADRPGHVYVQTFSPEHPAIVTAAKHDYETFARQEIKHRREFLYPPWTVMMRVIVRGARLADVEGFAEQLGKRLLKLKDATRARFRVMGPAPAPIARIKNRFRYHLLVLAQDDRTLQDAAASIGDVDVPKEVQWIVDIDPVDLQ